MTKHFLFPALVAAVSAVSFPHTPVHAQQTVAEQEEVPAPFDAAAAWQEFEGLVRGAYAYVERGDIDVDAQMARSQQLALKAKNSAEFRQIIHQTALTFMDPHFIVGPFTDGDYAIVMTAADLDAKFADGRLMIADVRNGSPAYEAGIRPGDEVTSIGGVGAADAARKPFGEMLPDPTAPQLDYGALLAVNGQRGSARQLTIVSAEGASQTINLISTLEYARSLETSTLVSVSWTGADNDVAVLRIANDLGNNDMITAFDAAVAEAAGARALILDMRGTPSGGNTEVGRSIIGHFTRELMPYQMHVIPAIEREFTVPRQFVELVHPRAPYYGGPVFVLHGRWTGSMGEGVVIGMDAATDAVTIGSDMGDLLGALWNFDLKNSEGRVDLAGEALFHVDGTPRADYVASIVVSPADTDSDGSDPAIAAALSALNGME